MVDTIKIFGERNTSTNALKALIETNSKSCVAPSTVTEVDPAARQRLRIAKKLRLPHTIRERMIDQVFAGRDPLDAWKHTWTRFDDVQCFVGRHVVFCVRHPTSWLLGLYKRPYHIYGRSPEGLREFLDKRWKTVGRERLGRAETSAIALYNLKATAFVDLQARLTDAGATYSVIRHEDFAVDQAKVFARLAPYLDGHSQEFKALETSTKDVTKTRSYYQDYYGKQRWRDEVDAECAARINDQIDWSAVTDYGYSPT